MYSFLKTLKWLGEDEQKAREYWEYRQRNGYTEENGYYSYDPKIFTHRGRYVKYVLRGNEYYDENVLFAVSNESIIVIKGNKTYQALRRINDRKFCFKYEELGFNDGAYESRDTLKLIKDRTNDMNTEQIRYANVIALLVKAAEFNSMGSKNMADNVFHKAMEVMNEQPYVICRDDDLTYIQFWHRKELYGNDNKYKRTILLNDIFFGTV